VFIHERRLRGSGCTPGSRAGNSDARCPLNQTASSPSSVRTSSRVVEIRMRAGSCGLRSALVDTRVCVLLWTRLPGKSQRDGVEEGMTGSVSTCSPPIHSNVKAGLL